MSLLNVFRKAKEDEPEGWLIALDKEGIRISRPGLGEKATPGVGQSLSGLVTQLADDGYASKYQGGAFFLPWESFYAAAASPDYETAHVALGLPAFTELRPVLSSRNSLVDDNFTISIRQWVSPFGEAVTPEFLGPVISRGGNRELMGAHQWQLVQQVVAFANRDDSERSSKAQELAWGRIRRTAVLAAAEMSDFLVKTVVLSPERLDMKFHRSDAVKDDTVVEILPVFEGAPDNWLEEFDRFDKVQDTYKFALPNGGLVHIAVPPDVKAVLSEIKRLPGRLVAGSRAQAFLRNPFATLGDVAANVLDEKQFETAREEAGLQFERFTAIVERDKSGFPDRVGILVEAASSKGHQSSNTYHFDDQLLKLFIGRVERAQALGLQLVLWEGHELEILGDTEEQLALLRSAYENRTQPSALVTHSIIYDLTSYSGRIESIGVEKPYYSPFIAKREEGEGWFPENVFPVVAYTPDGASEPIAVPVSDAALKELKQATDNADAAGDESVSLPWLPKPMPLAEAKQISLTFDEVLSEVKDKTFDPEKELPRKPVPRKTLVLRSNIDAVDYDEQRREALAAPTAPFYAPRGLNS